MADAYEHRYREGGEIRVAVDYRDWDAFHRSWLNHQSVMVEDLEHISSRALVYADKEPKTTCPVCQGSRDADQVFCVTCLSNLRKCDCCGEKPDIYRRVCYEGDKLVHESWPFMQCDGCPPCQTVQKETEKECFEEWNALQTRDWEAEPDVEFSDEEIANLESSLDGELGPWRRDLDHKWSFDR